MHDYRRRQGVASSRIILPDEARPPARPELWNAAELAETRKNSTVARDLIVALPHELSAVDRRQLAEDMGQWVAQRYGVAADVAVHLPGQDGDSRNHHAHILFTTRRLTGASFGAKTRELDDKTQGPQEIETIREAWEQLTNQALERAGLGHRVDRRSHLERGTGLEPAAKEGPGERRHRQRNRQAGGDTLRRAFRESAARRPQEATRSLVDEWQGETAQPSAKRDPGAPESLKRPGGTRMSDDNQEASDRAEAQRIVEARMAAESQQLRDLQRREIETLEREQRQLMEARREDRQGDINERLKTLEAKHDREIERIAARHNSLGGRVRRLFGGGREQAREIEAAEDAKAQAITDEGRRLYEAEDERRMQLSRRIQEIEAEKIKAQTDHVQARDQQGQRQAEARPLAIEQEKTRLLEEHKAVQRRAQALEADAERQRRAREQGRGRGL